MKSGPVGQGDYIVKQGECLSSIAFKHGFHWETLWNLSENAELKRARKSPNVLLPGDRLTIPRLRPGSASANTNGHHRFSVQNVPARVRLRFLEDGEPLSGESYYFDNGVEIRSGVLDSQGRLNEIVPPDTESVRVRIGESVDWVEFPLGSLDPVTEVTGLQGRLANLGYHPGAVDGVMGHKTRGAIARFQVRHGLEPTGKPDSNTRSKLAETHGS